MTTESKDHFVPLSNKGFPGLSDLGGRFPSSAKPHGHTNRPGTGQWWGVEVEVADAGPLTVGAKERSRGLENVPDEGRGGIETGRTGVNQRGGTRGNTEEFRF